MCKWSSLVIEHKDYNYSRALELIKAFQVEKSATKKTGRDCGDWIEVHVRSPVTLKIVEKIISAVDKLVQKAIIQFTPSVVECKNHIAQMIAKSIPACN